MRWLGCGLLCWGGFWWWRAALLERRRRQQTLERLLSALYQLREGIRMARLPLPRLLEQAAEEEPFFGAVLRELRQNETLAEAWRRESDALQLPAQSGRAWRWLGDRLTGDEQHVLQAMAYTEHILEQERRKMAEEAREAERRTTAVCFSCTALAIILFL